MISSFICFFFFSSRRRHTRCALVTGVQTCALPNFTAYVLFYRLPGDGWKNSADAPLADAQRAVRLVRSRARQDGIDPARVAFGGFSAGGHVATSLLTRFNAGVYDPVDGADVLPARPDALAGLYPVVSMDPAIAHADRKSTRLNSSH